MNIYEHKPWRRLPPQQIALVSLTDWQLSIAKLTGLERARDAIAHRWQNIFTPEREADQQSEEKHHIMGAMGECGASKLFNVLWPMSVKPDGQMGDCTLPNGSIVQVRANKFPKRDAWDLYPWVFSWDANPNRLYIFTMAETWAEAGDWSQLMEVIVLGWRTGKDVGAYPKSDQLPTGTRLPRASHIVPVNELLDLRDLDLQLWNYSVLQQQ